MTDTNHCQPETALHIFEGVDNQRRVVHIKLMQMAKSQHEGKPFAFTEMVSQRSYGGTEDNGTSLSQYNAYKRGFSRLCGTYACPEGEQVSVQNMQGGTLSKREEEHYPKDLEAFQQALRHMDSRFMKIAKETASPTPKNAEILESLGLLWRQRRLEQLQEEEQQQHLDGRVRAPLYGSIDEAIVGKKSGSAFRARAYKMAYEILHRSRIPIYNVAEALLLLRDGGLLLRGEETNLVKRGAFRSAVLQKIHVVLSHGITELMRQSRSILRDGAVQDLSRLPGVTRRTAATLFEDYFIDSSQALRERLSALNSGMEQLPGNSQDSWAPPASVMRNGTKFRGLPSEADNRLAKLFPTDLSRACIMHSDSFSAPMETAEFDEWQQQLLLVQQDLRGSKDLTPSVPLDLPDTFHGAAQDFPSKLPAWPVVSLGGGIFRGSNCKLISLALQVSLLPSWTEEGLLPPSLDHAICCGGRGAKPEEIAWVQRQWGHVSQAYRTIRRQLHSSAVDALKQRNLISKVFSETSRTKTTHAAGQLPWRQETYRLMTIQTVTPRAFPFATLAARCSPSAYRLLQTRTRSRWGCNLTPSGITASSAEAASVKSPHENALAEGSALHNTIGVTPYASTGGHSTSRHIITAALEIFYSTMT
ncbi:hypothetical protein cyc_06735 [Cyclospora cayetanensis]|uniref:Uncharacterized protein n=1 Tax=Cyclospora cayetanensis TaxID=88456 RepID=A0A1D3CYM9_9EIME|nr:hypothetical protein cyc_06735 [Cyclospora cayetanensis]